MTDQASHTVGPSSVQEQPQTQAQTKVESTPAPAPAPTQHAQAPTQSGEAPKTPVKAPLFRIMPLKALARSRRVKVLVYGKYGAGKTSLAASAVDVPSMRDVLLVSIEGGEMSAHDNPIFQQDDLIDVVQVRGFKELQPIKDFLTAHIIFRDNNEEDKLRAIQERVLGVEEDTRLRRYNTVIIDSLTELNDLCMADLLGLADGMTFTQDLPTAEFKEYKQNFNKIQMLVRMFRDLKMNILFTCATSYEQDEQKAYHYTPMLTGRLSTQVQGFFDLVGFLVTGVATEDSAAPRRLWVQPVGGKFDCKSRLSACRKPYFDNPTMMKIMSEVGLAT